MFSVETIAVPRCCVWNMVDVKLLILTDLLYIYDDVIARNTVATQYNYIYIYIYNYTALQSYIYICLCYKYCTELCKVT